MQRRCRSLLPSSPNCPVWHLVGSFVGVAVAAARPNVQPWANTKNTPRGVKQKCCRQIQGRSLEPKWLRTTDDKVVRTNFTTKSIPNGV
eukprot:4033610-Amphidinium_carterae.2